MGNDTYLAGIPASVWAAVKEMRGPKLLDVAVQDGGNPADADGVSGGGNGKRVGVGRRTTGVEPRGLHDGGCCRSQQTYLTLVLVDGAARFVSAAMPETRRRRRRRRICLS